MSIGPSRQLLRTEGMAASEQQLKTEAQQQTMRHLALDIHDLVNERLGKQKEGSNRNRADVSNIVEDVKQLLKLTDRDKELVTVKRTYSMTRKVRGLPTTEQMSQIGAPTDKMSQIGARTDKMSQIGATTEKMSQIKEDEPSKETMVDTKQRQRQEKRVEDLKELVKKAEERKEQMKQMTIQAKNKQMTLEDQLVKTRTLHEKYKFRAYMWTRNWKQKEMEMEQRMKGAKENQQEIKRFQEQTNYIGQIIKGKDKTAAELNYHLEIQGEEAAKERRLMEQKCKKMASKNRQEDTNTIAIKQNLDAALFREKRLEEKLQWEKQMNEKSREEIAQEQRTILEIANKLDGVAGENINLRDLVARHGEDLLTKLHLTQQASMPVTTVPSMSDLSSLLQPSSSVEQIAPYYGTVEQENLSQDIIDDLDRAVKHLQSLRSLRMTEQMEKFENQLHKFLNKIRHLLRARENIAGSPTYDVIEQLTKLGKRAVSSESTQSSRDCDIDSLIDSEDQSMESPPLESDSSLAKLTSPPESGSSLAKPTSFFQNILNVISPPYNAPISKSNEKLNLLTSSMPASIAMTKEQDLQPNSVSPKTPSSTTASESSIRSGDWSSEQSNLRSEVVSEYYENTNPIKDSSSTESKEEMKENEEIVSETDQSSLTALTSWTKRLEMVTKPKEDELQQNID